MPFDITLHPVAAEDLERFVFDVWSEPTLAEVRAAELTNDATKGRFVIEAIYGAFPAWRQTHEEGGDLPLARTLGFCCAAIAGFRHDYVYTGSSALSFAAEALPELDLFSPLARSVAGAAAFAAQREEDDAGRLVDNYSASGLLLPERFDELRQGLELLETRRGAHPTLFALFRDTDRAALDEALRYAEARGLALLEAADLVEPGQRRGSTDLDRLRARRPLHGGGAINDLFPCRRASRPRG